MATNTDLTREQAVLLVKGHPVTCPKCEKEILKSRYGHKNRNTELKCPACGEIYRPCRLI